MNRTTFLCTILLSLAMLALTGAIPAAADNKTPAPVTASPPVATKVVGSATVSASPPGTRTAVPATASPSAVKTAPGSSSPLPTRSPVSGTASPSPLAVASAASSQPVRVDVGGNGYKDEATGMVWEADRPYGQADASGRIWGYLGPRSMQVIGTSRPIAGTTLSRLYQTERVGATGYRFDLPNGQYRVTVRMAELYNNVGPGRNIFDVMCQGKSVLNSIDVAKSAGIYQAYDRVFTTTVSAGLLDLTFVPRSGWVAIAGLDIEGTDVVATPVPTAASPTLAASPSAVPTAPKSPVIATTTAVPSVVPSATRLPSPSPSVVVTVTPSPTSTAAPSATATSSATATASPSPQQTPTLPPTPSSTATLAPTSSSTATVPPTATALPLPSNTPTASPSPGPSLAVPTETPTTVPTATVVPTPTQRAAVSTGLQRISQNSFSVVFVEQDRPAAQDVLDAMTTMALRLKEEVGLAVSTIEVRLFSSRQEYNEALGMTVPADQVGNIVDQGHIWLLTPNKDNPAEYTDILKGAQVEMARLALAEIVNIPQWLRDGIASYEARLWNDARQQYMRGLVAMRRITSLRGLEGQTYNYLGGAVSAHTVIDYLTKTYGTAQLPRLVAAIKTRSLDQALREVVGVSLADFDRGWVAYVNATYGR